MIIVKVGGSLFDLPNLGPGLCTYLKALAPAEVILVAGGGAGVEAVRALDRAHGFGEEFSHWLALRALGVTAAGLERITHGRVLDCLAFAIEDESRPGALPHAWDVTSDSIAARAALVHRAVRLVLLKSVDVPHGTTWEEAAARGWVDAHFPRIATNAPFAIEVVNFRRRLESPGAELLNEPLR